MTFISTQLINSEEQADMRKMFSEMDINNDGKLTKEELITGFRAMDVDDPEAEAEQIMKTCDFDNSGSIEFTEWCTASMDKRTMLSKDRLRAAFEIFDKDGSGHITFDEIRDLMGYGGVEGNNQEFKDMVAEMDLDGDGQISF